MDNNYDEILKQILEINHNDSVGLAKGLALILAELKEMNQKVDIMEQELRRLRSNSEVDIRRRIM